jgi:SAM-dependent methyltransferase
VTTQSGGHFYKNHPKTCDPEDFWGQVGRTVNGKPVDQAQIDMIVTAVMQGLKLHPDDLLLDLCCGNGALTAYFFARCRGGLGVDFSDCLIEVAQRYFSTQPEYRFEIADVVEFVRSAIEPHRFTKALCYGAFQYLGHSAGEELLSLLRYRFVDIDRLLIGNLPDKSLLGEFYRNRPYTSGVENRSDTPIGIWRTEDEFIALAKRTGWQCTIVRMPSDFYAAHYRYDVILTPLQ